MVISLAVAELAEVPPAVEWAAVLEAQWAVETAAGCSGESTHAAVVTAAMPNAAVPAADL